MLHRTRHDLSLVGSGPVLTHSVGTDAPAVRNSLAYLRRTTANTPVTAPFRRVRSNPTLNRSAVPEVDRTIVVDRKVRSELDSVTYLGPTR
jgi:hypothetical protein